MLVIGLVIGKVRLCATIVRVDVIFLSTVRLCVIWIVLTCEAYFYYSLYFTEVTPHIKQPSPAIKNVQFQIAFNVLNAMQ